MGNIWKRHCRGSLWLLVAFLIFALAVCQENLAQKLEWNIQLCREMEKDCSREQIRELMEEVQCFPVKYPKETVHSDGEKETSPYTYEDGYGEGRNYGGERKHEGIDIMSRTGGRKELQIVAVADGVIEKTGWLKLGGYRIGIRSESGMYYYYAHLESYEKGIQEGKKVKAGQVLGWMGDTGYGSEGTRGKFPVHLHFGLYRKAHGKEESINPYHLLRYLEGGDLK